MKSTFDQQRIYESTVQCVTLYGSEVWVVNQRNRNKLLATRMDYFRGSCRKSRWERIRSKDVRANKGTDKIVMDEVEEKQVIWFGHVSFVQERRRPKSYWNAYHQIGGKEDIQDADGRAT